MTRTRRVVAAAAVVVAVTVTGGAIARSGANPSTPTASDPTTSTAPVTRGTLSATVSLAGFLTHRARPDGSPYYAINQARGTYTMLPEVGAKVGCGDELYRVDDTPVLLLCGSVPAYRDLHAGDVGNDVRQLNTNLHSLGFDAAAGVDIDPGDNAFTGGTGKALEKLQDAKGLHATGELAVGDALFLPEPAQVAKVTGARGGPAQPGAPVLDATSDSLEVQVNLEGSQQNDIEPGDRVRITLPSNTSLAGKVDRLGTVAQAPAGPNGSAGAGPATIPVSISFDEPEKVGGLDQAPVQVEITTQGVQSALSVPVTAIVGRSGGGFAVEVVRDDGRHELAAVELGLFDTAEGRVQVDGDVREGDLVVVPSS